MKKISEMKIGEHGIISKITNDGEMRHRLMELGFLPGTEIICTVRSPLGDPTAYTVKGAVIALRSEESKKIYIGHNRS